MKHLQYSFFVDSIGNLVACDKASEEFLDSIDLADFQAHLQSLELNNANLATTILLNRTSYTLRLVPVSAVRSAAQARILEVDVSPGMTERSLFPAACQAAGLTLSGVLDKLVTM